MRILHVSFLLPDFIRGSLGRDDTTRVETHLRICPACQSEFEELTNAFASIARLTTRDVPKSYFASILPRVHERLDHRRNTRWIHHPLVNRIVLPLGAAIVIAVLVWRIPLPNSALVKENSLMAVGDSATSEDIAEIVQADIPSQDWSSFNAMIISHALTNDRFVQRELVQEALASEATSPFDVFADVSPQQVLSDFDETQTNEILERLGHMETL